jgi:hypothetical protein
MVKTKELEKEEVKEEVKEDNYDVIYKSKLLNKEFTDLDELKKAESEYKLEVAKKEEAKLARKEEATVVQKAIDNYEVAKVKANDVIANAYKEYKDKVAEAEKALAEVEKTASEALDKFLADHPEGFHYTYKSEDGKVVREYNYYKNRYDVFDNFNQFTELLKKLWF